MPIIKTNKKYDYIVTLGCSFNGGHHLGPDGAWGHFLAKKLDCSHIKMISSASNPAILASLINFCEHNDMTNACVGIQWTEATRRELWEETNNTYYTIGLGGLLTDHLWERNAHREWLTPVKNNLGFFSSVWFDIRENTLRTILAMIQAKAYLEYKNIDFIMFEGINSIMDINDQNVRFDGLKHPSDLALLSDKIKLSILNEDTFFNELGDLNKAMREHPAFDPTLNDGHPHPEILHFWTHHLYHYIQKIENKSR